MGSIDVLTVNEKPDRLDLIKVVEEAKHYFSAEAWDDVRYIGELKINHDITMVTDREKRGAFLVENLTKRIRKIKDIKLVNLLLGITEDPIIAMFYYFDGKTFKRSLFLVHDYVSEKIGVVSLFRVEEEAVVKVVAHGLGHSKGLMHHYKPIDYMYSKLLNAKTLQIEGFCKTCQNQISNTQTN
jgi:predicted Zn-dependent protease